MSLTLEVKLFLLCARLGSAPNIYGNHRYLEWTGLKAKEVNKNKYREINYQFVDEGDLSARNLKTHYDFKRALLKTNQSNKKSMITTVKFVSFFFFFFFTLILFSMLVLEVIFSSAVFASTNRNSAFSFRFS